MKKKNASQDLGTWEIKRRRDLGIYIRKGEGMEVPGEYVSECHT